VFFPKSSVRYNHETLTINSELKPRVDNHTAQMTTTQVEDWV